MNYIEWVAHVGDVFARTEKRYQQSSLAALSVELGLIPPGVSLDKHAHQALWHAIQDLGCLGVIQVINEHQLAETEATRRLRAGAQLRSTWPQFFASYLEPAPAEFLNALVRLSLVADNGWADTAWLTAAQVFTELGWSTSERTDITRAHELCNVLEEPQADFIQSRRASGSLPAILLRPNYRGVVRATQQLASEWQQRLGALVDEWETVTVDFKETLALKTDRQKAEFVKDAIALATTKASGRERYIVVGYNDESRTFTAPLDPSIDQDRIENIVNAYIRPPHPGVRLIRVPIGVGEVGVIELTRDPRHVPYRVAKAVQKLVLDDVFVRHGTHAARPDPEELAELMTEAERADRDA